MIENAATMGRILGQRLEDLKARHTSVGGMRYIGLFSVIKLAKNKATREPFREVSRLFQRLAQESGPRRERLMRSDV